MASAEETPRESEIPSARTEVAPAEKEEGWDSQEEDPSEARGGDPLVLLALAAAAELVEEPPERPEQAAGFAPDPSEGHKDFVDTLLGGDGACAPSRRALQAPRYLADPLSRLDTKRTKEPTAGLWDNAEVRGRVADVVKSLKAEASFASRPAAAASLPSRDDPAGDSFDLGSLGGSLGLGGGPDRGSSPRFSPPIAPVTGMPRPGERKRRNAVFNSPHRLAPWGEGVRVTPSLSLSPREVLDRYDRSPDRSFEEENADDLQFHLDMEYPLAHQRSERVDGRDDVDTPELSSDGTEESPVRLRPNIGLASPRYTSRFFSSCGGR